MLQPLMMIQIVDKTCVKVKFYCCFEGIKIFLDGIFLRQHVCSLLSDSSTSFKQ